MLEYPVAGVARNVLWGVASGTHPVKGMPKNVENEVSYVQMLEYPVADTP